MKFINREVTNGIYVGQPMAPRESFAWNLSLYLPFKI